MKAVSYLSFSQKVSILLLILSLNSHLFGQTEIKNSVETEISGGAEYSIFLENMINSGNGWMLQHNENIPNDPLYKTDLISTIEGINFNEDATNGGFYHIPPDPIGAAGPSHLVSVVNTSIEWHTKVGVQEVSMRLGKNSTTHIGSFFESLTPTTGTFDPKVIYDQYASRFVVVTLERVGTIDGLPSNISRILLAVSDDSDPNGTWYYHAIDSKLTIGVTDSWADYPGFAVDEEAVYVTANMFRFSGGFSLDSRVWIIAKSPFYSGGAASVSVYAFASLAGLPGGTAGTTQPTHMFGTPSSSTLGAFLVGSGWSSGSTELLSVIKVETPLSSPTFTNTFVSLGDIFSSTAFSDAPQFGTSALIETNDIRVLNAVWRSDLLWVVNCILPSSGTDAGQVTAHWYKVSTSSTPSLSDQGNIGGESIATGCYTFFPSIAVNSSGAVCIGFSASASTIYPGCYFTGRLSTDPAGSTITPDVVKAGVDYYYRAFGGTRNRWGDYSGASVDPSDDLTFYVFNEYALTRGTVLPSYPTEDGRWGTAFGIVPVSVLPVELSSFTAKVSKSGGVQMDWRTETELSNYGFEIERASSSTTPLQGWEKIGFVEGHGNSNSPKDYSFTDNAAGYGKLSYRLKQIDTDGQFEYSKVIEVDAGNIPSEIVLEQNYPNPFNPSTKIKFVLAETQTAKLIAYDVLGNEVAVPFNGAAEGGKLYEVEFNANHLSSGLYFYQLSTESRVENRKMLLLK